MALDVEVPDPPELANRGVPAAFEPAETVDVADFRREELETFLDEGAWQEGFDEWAAYTDLTADQFERVQEAGLVDRLDFFWDPRDRLLQFDAPSLPDEWYAGDGPFDEPTVSLVETELSDLGRAVAETLADTYVDWGSDEESDPVWSEETFGQSRGEGE
ncbi:hypothetical protein ACFQH6_17320 [Halobacteriaceae archaeon GCM10025711]